MGIFDVFKKETKKEASFVDYNYLNHLIDEVKELRERIKFCEIDFADCYSTYMPKKKTSFVGFKQGYFDYLIRSQNSMKETDKLRSTTKDYLKFVKNKDGELIKIESFINGKLDCLFQVCWIENVRYLLPFSAEGGYYPTYVYATKYKKDCIVEEYMVDGKHIVYETYTYVSSEEVDYSYINYVLDGNYPIREKRQGKFKVNPLTYEEIYNDTWLNHR